MYPSAGASAPALMSKIAKPLEESIGKDQISSPVMCVTLGNSTKGEGLEVGRRARNSSVLPRGIHWG
jgi:hypothetical protein